MQGVQVVQPYGLNGLQFHRHQTRKFVNPLQEHYKAFQTLNNKDMYKAFLEDNPQFVGVVSKHAFKKHKPAWIHKAQQE